MVDLGDIDLNDLICNVKESMKSYFYPKEDSDDRYARTTHTHTVDSSLSGTSTNPVQNKVVKNALDGKSNTDHTHGTASASSDGFLSSTLFTKLSNIATGATKNDPSPNNPVMDGTAAKGSETYYARGDHVHPTDTSRAPTSHKSSATTYGVSDASNYGHAMATTTSPKAPAASASLGSETGKFARGDHIHPLPPAASRSTNGLMSKEDKTKIDNIEMGATCNNVPVFIELFTQADSANGPIITITRYTNLQFRLYTEHYDAVPANYLVRYSLNGSTYSRSHGQSQRIELLPGDYRMDMIFDGGGIYNQAYRTVTLRVTS